MAVMADATAAGDGKAGDARVEADERPGSWWRWVRRRVMPTAAWASGVCGVLVLGLWLVGRVLTDTYAWSQYVWWVPTAWVIAAGVVLWVVSAVTGRLATRVSGLFCRSVLLLGVVGAAGWFGVVECRLVRAASPGGEGAVRVVSWNMASNGMWREAGDWVSGLGADVVVVANTPRTVTRGRILEGFGRVLEGVEAGEGTGERTTHRAFVGRFEVWSRLPIVRAGSVSVALPAGARTGWRSERVPAQAGFVEVETGSGLLVVWFVDLPSAPGLHRVASMRAAADAVRGWSGPELVADGSGGLMRSGAEVSGFPAAGVLVGDFNTPRGSDSIALVLEAAGSAGAMEDAHAVAGVGLDGTWKPGFRAMPDVAWWAIDLGFVGNGWSASGFEAVEPPAEGREAHGHHAVVVDVVRE